MKIIYFRLKGYVGIFHGMGLEEITIPFDKFNSRIVLIRGQNGCGKSTILNALSTDIDSSDNYRTDKIMSPDGTMNTIEYPAEKEIHLKDKAGSIYKILIKSDIKSNGTRDTTKAYISKDGEELNPKGNVNLYKEIRDSLFNINSTCMKLSLVSSEDRGLVDKIPSARKDFLVNIMGDMGFYNETYKTLSKKSSAYRSMINNIKAKLYNMGDENTLRASLVSCNARLDSLNKERDKYLKLLADSEATIRIIDPDNEIQNLYNSIVDELSDVRKDLMRFNSQCHSLYERLELDPQIVDIQSEYESVSGRVIKVKSDIENSKSRLAQATVQRDSVVKSIDSTRVKRESLISVDISDDIETVIDDLKTKIDMYGAYLKSMEQDPNITKSELETADIILASIKVAIDNMRDKYSDYDLNYLESITSNHSVQEWIELQRKEISEAEKSIHELEDRKSELMIKTSELHRQIEIKNSVLSKRPEGCNIDTCPFLLEAIELSNNKIDSEYEESAIEYDVVKNCITNDSLILAHMKYQLEMVIDFNNSVLKIIELNKPLLSKLPRIMHKLENAHNIAYAIASHNGFDEFSSIKDMIKDMDLVEDYNRCSTELTNLESEYIVYKNNKIMEESMDELLKSYERDLANYDIEITSLHSSISFNENLLIELSKRESLLKDLIIAKGNHKATMDRKAALSDKYAMTKDKISKVKSTIDRVAEDQEVLARIENEIVPLQNEIGKINFALANIASYQDDLKNYADTFDKIEVLKKASSPTSGIQLLFMSVYFGKIIMLCNELLEYLFGGQLKLLKPEIDAKGFSIPFVNKYDGITEDVSLGSTSQRCMIAMVLSFALLTEASTLYDIIRLDEIDGGLDTDNRLMFIYVLNKLMDILNVEQCIMISHNTELEQSACIINLSQTGLTFEF